MPRDTGGQLVEREFFTLPVWDRLDAHSAEAVARSVERCLPEPWAFARVAWHECGGQKRHVAFFDFNGNAFALIPGGEVTLGYDPSRPGPPAELLAEWNEEAAIYARNYPEWAGRTWDRYVAQVMSPLRQVVLSPFLIAVRGAAKSQPTGASERKAIAKGGFRLPTADEWEFACSAGSRSLWHWGDDPGDGPPEVNAFGLDIVRDTYVLEPLHEPGHYRGGDGGQREHGGACDLEGFVPRASWFGSRRNPEQENWWQFTRYRRAFPLPEAMFG